MDKSGLKDKLERLDQLQQRKPALALPIATVKKFGEDKSSDMASMMAFWAFFSIFPLLLALVTLLGYVLPPDERKRVLEQASSYFPLLDVSKMGALHGSWLALSAGLLSALWSGSAVVRVTETAFNAVWEVPQVAQPKLIEKLKRSMLALVTIGLGLLGSTLLIGFLSGDNPTVHLGWTGRLLGFALAIGVDIGLFVVAFRMLTDRDIDTRDVLPGAIFSGLAFWVLQSLSSVIITRHLSSAQSTYGSFATVITIMWWFYLQSQLTLLGAQVNVVLKEHFYPRGLIDPPDTEADRRLLEAYADERTYVEGEEVDSRVPEDHGEDTGAEEKAGHGDGGKDRTGRVPARRRG